VFGESVSVSAPWNASLTLSLPKATIVAHIPWLPLVTISAVFTQYIKIILNF